MARKSRMGKIGVYGCKTRKLQRCLSYEAFGLSMKEALIYLYQGNIKEADPSIKDLGSTVFFEVPDRIYADTPIAIPVGMEQMNEMATDFSRFGLINPMMDENTFRIHMDDMDALGRELMVGDVFEIPFHNKGDRKALWEVTDVDFRSEMERYTIVVKASPLKASRKTESLNHVFNGTADDFMVDIQEGEHKFWEEEVPTQDLVYDKDEDVEPEPVDYRNKVQADFLDDPFKTF